MAASQKKNDMTDKTGKIFNPKIFALSLAVLLAVFLIGTGSYLAFFAKPIEKPTMTGKVMAKLDVQPVQAEEDPPAPKQEETPDTEHHATEEDIPAPAEQTMEAKPLEETDLPSHEDTATAKEAEDVTSHPDEFPEIEDAIAGLSEDSTYGPLPIIRSTDQMKVFEAYKAPFKLKSDTKAVIALVMTDYGLSDKSAKEALEKLPPFVTFIASPYAHNLQSKLSAARVKGKEIWMGIPIQGIGSLAQNDSGPIALLSGLKAKQNISRLNTALGHATGYAGVAFMNDSDFPDNSPELQEVIDTLAARGLGIAQLDPYDETIKLAATKAEAPTIQNTAWIDTIKTKDALLNALSKAEANALEKSYTVIAFTPSPITFDVIKEWHATLSAKNIQLCPLTYAIHQKNLTQK